MHFQRQSGGFGMVPPHFLVLLGRCIAGFAGHDSPCAVFPSICRLVFEEVAALVVDIGSGLCWLVFCLC